MTNTIDGERLVGSEGDPVDRLSDLGINPTLFTDRELHAEQRAAAEQATRVEKWQERVDAITRDQIEFQNWMAGKLEADLIEGGVVNTEADLSVRISAIDTSTTKGAPRAHYIPVASLVSYAREGRGIPQPYFEFVNNTGDICGYFAEPGEYDIDPTTGQLHRLTGPDNTIEAVGRELRLKGVEDAYPLGVNILLPNPTTE